MDARDFSDLGALDVHVWVVPLDDPDKRRRRELAHQAQGRILAAYLDSDPAALRFERLPSGKPVLADGALEFNLSHSGQVALVAVSGSLPVGVDVQQPHPTVSKPWFAKRICTPRELADLGAAGAGAAGAGAAGAGAAGAGAAGPDPDQLLRLWVRKEAVIKARGEGSYVSVGEVDVLEDRLADGWFCHDLPVFEYPGYRAAVATRLQPGASIALRGRFSPEANPRR